MKTHLSGLWLLISWFILSSSWSAFAGQGDWGDMRILDDERVYAATKQACSPLHPNDLYDGPKFDQLYAGIFPSPEFNQILGVIFSEEFAKNTVYLLEGQENENQILLLGSTGFKKALAECFAEPDERKRFVWLVSMRQRGARFAGLIASLAVLKGVSSVIGRISVTAAHVVRGAEVTAAVSVMSLQSYQLIQQWSQHRQIKKACGDDIRLNCFLHELRKIDATREFKTEFDRALNNDLEKLLSLPLSEGDRAQVEDLKKQSAAQFVERRD